jgi:hypothetical protein
MGSVAIKITAFASGGGRRFTRPAGSCNLWGSDNGGSGLSKAHLARLVWYSPGRMILSNSSRIRTLWDFPCVPTRNKLRPPFFIA